MIGRLSGILLDKNPPKLVVDVNGVGYEVESSMTSIYQMGQVNERVTLYTHLVVREDAQLLYGFIAEQERDMFRELIKISGVGPKVALAILSSLTLSQLIETVSNNQLAQLTRVPGIGKKTGQRLMVELQSRLANFGSDNVSVAVDGVMPSQVSSPVNEAVEALIALGYKPQDANNAVRLVKDQAEDAESLIRLALKRKATC